jgi:hypothetical protein
MKKPNNVAQTSSKRIVEQRNNFTINYEEHFIEFSVICENFGQKVPYRLGCRVLRIDKQDKAFEIENNRQTVISVKDATIKGMTIQIQCNGEHGDGVL